MSEFFKPENIGFFLSFVVPGFIILYFRSQFICRKLPSVAESIVSCMILSALYQASVLLFIPTSLMEHPAVWLVLVFVLPALLGVLLGLTVQKDWIRTVIRKTGLNPVHVVPTAWDWYFARSLETWVKISLKNGDVVRGFLSKDSFLSSDPSERDLFLSMVYSQPTPESDWVSENTSMWIAHDQIRSIEFIPKTETT